VREDYSPIWNCLGYFLSTLDARTYPAGVKDGIGGICDRNQRLLRAALERQDPILKERLLDLPEPGTMAKM